MEEFRICFDSYEVSNFGNVRRKLLNGEYKILKCSIQNKGYKYFQTNRDKKRINYLVHHLVAKVFIGERPDNLVIDHIDRNPLNNNVNNLRYITQKENTHNSSKYNNEINEEGNERHKIICKIYRDNNKDKIKEQKKAYTEANKEQKKVYDKKRYDEKREELIKQTKDWYIKNKEHRKEYMKKYNQKKS
jgi:IS5 family transposase